MHKDAHENKREAHGAHLLHAVRRVVFTVDQNVANKGTKPHRGNGRDRRDGAWKKTHKKMKRIRKKKKMIEKNYLLLNK